jgi:hypothetical protein
MPTQSTTAKRLARNTAAAKASKTAAAKSAAKARRPRAQSAAATADDASLRDLVARLAKLELAGLAGKLVQGWRTDLEAVVQASRRSYAGLQEIVQRQTAQIKESVRNLDNLALASLQLALTDIRELAALAATSQREAFDIVQQRVTANIDEVQQLLRK